MSMAREQRVTADIVTAENLEICEKLLLSLETNQTRLAQMTRRSPVICSVADIRCVLQNARDVKDLIDALKAGIRDRRRWPQIPSAPMSGVQPNPV